MVAGGGIFPDLEIANDTLTLVEREFLSQAARDEVPLVLRIEEFAFAQADSRRGSGEAPGVDADDFRAFLEALSEEGVDARYIADPVITDYLEWRISQRVAERMDRMGRSMEIRSLRDPVLAEAIRLLGAATTQSDLFQAVAGLKGDKQEAQEESLSR